MHTSSTKGLEAFSDGVIAIAITLLILEIRVPDMHELPLSSGLWAALWQRWPNYVGYVLRFLVIGAMWANHHALFTSIRRVDRAPILSNLLLMMGVAFVPFPTALLAKHPAPSEAEVRMAVSGNLCRCGTYLGVFEACRTVSEKGVRHA